MSRVLAAYLTETLLFAPSNRLVQSACFHANETNICAGEGLGRFAQERLQFLYAGANLFKKRQVGKRWRQRFQFSAEVVGQIRLRQKLRARRREFYFHSSRRNL